MTNPAMTLHDHLEHLRGMAQDQVTWPQAWTNRIGVPWDEGVRDLLGLVDDTKSMLAQRPRIDLAKALAHEPEWRRSILLPRINLDVVQNQSGFTIDPVSLNSLYNVAQIIDSMPQASSALSQAQIDTLAKAVSELRAEVLAATDIDDELRSFLLDEVNEIEKRLAHRTATGDQPILNLVPELIGSSAVHAKKWDKARGSSLSTKILAFWAAIHLVATGINTAASDFEDIQNALKSTATVVEYVLGDGPPAIEAPKQNALPAGTSETGEMIETEAAAASEPSDVVDAEVIEEEPQQEPQQE